MGHSHVRFWYIAFKNIGLRIYFASSGPVSIKKLLNLFGIRFSSYFDVNNKFACKNGCVFGGFPVTSFKFVTFLRISFELFGAKKKDF